MLRWQGQDSIFTCPWCSRICSNILWHNTPITVSQAATATVAVHNQHEGDPAFAVDGYHLTNVSAAIDQGVDAGVMTDIDEQARPQGAAPDMGADEYIALSVSVNKRFAAWHVVSGRLWWRLDTVE